MVVNYRPINATRIEREEKVWHVGEAAISVEIFGRGI
jgi:hypothetical protein